MKDFCKYLTSGPGDKTWGLYLTVAGAYVSLPGGTYPAVDHPTGYYFEWDTWRILDEYQFVYIYDGHGVLETHQDVYRISPGTMILLRPGLKHRYRPDKESGWSECYMGFSGSLARHFTETAFDKLEVPVIKCTNHYELLDTFTKVNQIVMAQQPGYQKICSGLLLKLMGYIESQLKSQQFKGKEVDTLVNEAKKIMWENADEDIDFHEFARRYHVSYSYFRKVFKIYTGIAPHQYLLDCKVMRARELIRATDIPIKEISYRMGFTSIQYFSRMFKSKTGQAPSELRNFH